MAAACDTDRLRPGPPIVSLALTKTEAAPTDTITGAVEATSPDGIDSLFVVLEGEIIGQNGRLDTRARLLFRWDLGGRFARGDSTLVHGFARDGRGFVGRDSQTVRIR